MPPPGRRGEGGETPVRSDKKSKPKAGARPPRPKKRFSQNFLADANMAQKIVDVSGIEPGDTVLEIGPGQGALTGLLLDRAQAVHAVEVDRELCARLRVEYAEQSGFHLHEGDVLQLDPASLVSGPAVAVGNLPYAITSDLVLWLIRYRAHFRRAVVMMQREVAERLTAPPGARRAGRLTLTLNYHAEADRLFDVPPACFRPRPKVTSTVVAVRFRDHPPVQPADEDWFFKVIRAAYGERRKTLANALEVGLGVPRPRVEEALASLHLSSKVRGERLNLEQFAALADALGDG